MKRNTHCKYVLPQFNLDVLKHSFLFSVLFAIVIVLLSIHARLLFKVLIKYQHQYDLHSVLYRLWLLTGGLLFGDAIHHLYKLAARWPHPGRNRSSLGHDWREREIESLGDRLLKTNDSTVRHRSATLRKANQS